MTFDCRFQCSRVGLEVKIYDTPAGGIRASQGTFSSYMKNGQKLSFSYHQYAVYSLCTDCNAYKITLDVQNQNSLLVIKKNSENQGGHSSR